MSLLYDLDVYKIDMSGAEDKESNCITCHMLKITRTSTNIKKTKTHAFHSFLGARNVSNMLCKYINLSYNKDLSYCSQQYKTPSSLFH